MLDTVGPEVLVVNRSEKSIPLQEDEFVVLTPNQELEASSELLPINYDGLSKVGGWEILLNFILLVCCMIKFILDKVTS